MAPQVITTYSSSYSTAASSKNVSVTCAEGDGLVVYATGDNAAAINNVTITGATFQNILSASGNGTYGALAVHAALNIRALSAVTLTVTESTGTAKWGFTCVVVRNVRFIPVEAYQQSTSCLYNAGTSYKNSMVIAIGVDTTATDSPGRTWNTSNIYTPTAGGPLELTYQYVAGAYTTYAAFYPDCGNASTSNIVGIASPTGVLLGRTTGIELIGYDKVIGAASSSSSYANTTTRTANITVTTNHPRPMIFGSVTVGAADVSGVTTTATFDGLPMISLSKVRSNNGTQGYVEVFYLPGSPPTSGTAFVATASATVDMRVSAFLMLNVDYTNPIASVQTAYGSSTLASVTASVNDGRCAYFAVAASANNITGIATTTAEGTTTAGTASNFNNSTAGGCTAAMSVHNTANPATIGWNITSGAWAIIAVRINPSAYFPPLAVHGLFG